MYRVVKRTQGPRVWYVIQKYKRFFCWRWWGDMDFGIHPNSFPIESEAVDLVQYWTSPQKDEVVEIKGEKK